MARFCFFYALRLLVFFLCGQIHTLCFIQCRNVDLSKWRTLAIRSVWIRIVTKWIIQIGNWVIIFRCWFVLWLGSSITFLLSFFLNRSKHRRWTETTHQNAYVVVSVCCKACVHDQFNWALSWSLVSYRNMKENAEISVVERLQIEVGLLNWAQIKKMCK